MAVIKVGLVYYQDDPDKKVFRTVYQLDTDPPSVLDDLSFVTDGLDPLRTAVMDKYNPDNPDIQLRIQGTPVSVATTDGVE